MGKEKKGLIMKTWERCKSSSVGTMRSKSWPRASGTETDDKLAKKRRIIAPQGCFSVYVGAEKRRFVIRTEYANHPLFKILLEEAELEYGYNSEGPLALPCEVDIFCEVLGEMGCDKLDQVGCNFVRTHSSYHLLTPSRVVAMNKF